MASTQTLCAHCQRWPVYGTYNYCSKTCGQADKQSGGNGAGNRAGPAYTQQYPQQPIQPMYTGGYHPGGYGGYYSGWPGGQPNPQPQQPIAGMCVNCGRFPKANGYEYCSRTCGRNDVASRRQSFYMPQSPAYHYPAPQMGPAYGYPSYDYNMGYGPMAQQPMYAPPMNQPPMNQRNPNARPCKIPGCNNPQYGPGAKYCSMTCREDAVKKGIDPACLYCKKLPKTFRKHFCGQKCEAQALAKAPLLLEVPQNDPKWQDITKQFAATWTSANPPTIAKIYKVLNSKTTEDAFQAYRKTVEAKGNYTAQGKPAGNENRRWHGTVRECTIGDNPNNLTTCQSTTCRLCSIIKGSFNISYAANGSYGRGIYSSYYSSVSHGYTRAGTVGSPYRAMFLTRVVTGKEQIGGSSPGAGYDSVAADAKHRELIVYRNDAIAPSWLVLYS
ncbi:hypothetical protein FRB99_003354 [Tulasnella sp. 403]|nr:hypothetical protein FRB99_003354 [Tulasnella sp. 403]